MWDKIVVNAWDELPRWAQITAFFVALFVSLYLTLIPQFVNGYVYFKDEEGGMHGYRGHQVIVAIGGRDYKYTANENGYFSVPLISKLPESLRLGFVHPDTGGRYDIIIPFARMMTDDQLDFEVKSNPRSVVLTENVADLPGGFRVSQWVRSLPDLIPVHAAELRLPDDVRPIAESEAVQVNDRVLSIISNASGKPLSSLSDRTELTLTNGFSSMVKIRVVDAIEKTYRFKIPDEHWQSFRSVGEVVDYTRKRLALEKVSPSDDLNWASYQNRVRPNGEPLFVR